MTHWKLTLAYDGTGYHGWQVQPGLATVQGTLAEAIHHITGERVLPQGSGRTDAGVHALAQVASCSLEAPIPAANFHGALNRCLAPSIRVLKVEAVAADFHARHSAVRKTYEYRIFCIDRERICPPILAPYVWPCPWAVEMDAMNRAAGHVLGRHDFTTFAASDPDMAAREGGVEEQAGFSPVRTMYASHWEARGELMVYTVTGSGFLHHMVRNLVGTFVQAGAGRLDCDSIPRRMEARDRGQAGPTAPASGLFLVSVEYAERDGMGVENLGPATAL